jgi:serine-type D-Ala-D-Ala carboxypeptidase (penicillin-binding protein 5/6)
MRAWLLCIWLTMCPLLGAQALQVDLSAKAAILMNAETGAILYQKRAEEPLAPASVTKVATAWELLTHYPHVLGDMVVADMDSLGWISEELRKKRPDKVAPYWLETGATHAGIKVGEKLPMKDLLGLFLVGSANDAGNCIARHAAGTIPNFMAQMNQHLKAIGCRNTHFVNPHGLHRKGHHSCALDLALIMRAGWQYPLFRDLVQATSYPRPATNKQEASVVAQTNRLLRPGPFFYAKALGGKTGYTSDAGHNLVAVAQDPDTKRTLIGVVLGCESGDVRFREMVRLMETAFQEKPVTLRLLPAGPQSWSVKLPGGKVPLTTYTDADTLLTYYPSEKPQTQALLCWAPLSFPIEKGAPVGEVRFQTPDGKQLSSVVLRAAARIEPTLLWASRQWISSHPLGLTSAGLGLATVAIVIARRRRARRS